MYYTTDMSERMNRKGETPPPLLDMGNIDSFKYSEKCIYKDLCVHVNNVLIHINILEIDSIS